MKIRTRDFRVAQGATVRLRKWPTRVPPVYETNDAYEKMLTRHVSRLADLQELLYASDQYTLLVIFQGMDTSGKDGAIKHVMSGVNPQGCHVTSFKHPSATELQHDFLWRAVQALPERGCIGIFNRSYYEEVLVVRVHPELLRAEGLPDAKGKNGDVWKGRYRSIVDLENHLGRCGTRVIKFFLHLSKDEQRERLLARLDDQEKSWKFNVADIDERGFWPAYMLRNTKHSTRIAIPPVSSSGAVLNATMYDTPMTVPGTAKLTSVKNSNARRPANRWRVIT